MATETHWPRMLPVAACNCGVHVLNNVYQMTDLIEFLLNYFKLNKVS